MRTKLSKQMLFLLLLTISCLFSQTDITLMKDIYVESQAYSGNIDLTIGTSNSDILLADREIDLFGYLSSSISSGRPSDRRLLVYRLLEGGMINSHLKIAVENMVERDFRVPLRFVKDAPPNSGTYKLVYSPESARDVSITPGIAPLTRRHLFTFAAGRPSMSVFEVVHVQSVNLFSVSYNNTSYPIRGQSVELPENADRNKLYLRYRDRVNFPAVVSGTTISLPKKDAYFFDINYDLLDNATNMQRIRSKSISNVRGDNVYVFCYYFRLINNRGIVVKKYNDLTNDDHNTISNLPSTPPRHNNAGYFRDVLGGMESELFSDFWGLFNDIYIVTKEEVQDQSRLERDYKIKFIKYGDILR